MAKQNLEPDGSNAPALSFDAWTATNPSAASAALEKARTEALAGERKRVAGILNVGTQAVAGVKASVSVGGPVAEIFRAVCAAANDADKDASAVFGAVLAQATTLGANLAAPKAKDADDDEDVGAIRKTKAQVTRAELSENADNIEELVEDEDEDEKADEKGEPVAPASARAAMAKEFASDWRRMTPKARGKTGCVDERSYVGNRLGLAMGAFN